MMQIFIFLVFILRQGLGLIRYSISEELEYGSAVGNIAEHLGLIARELSARKCRLISADGSRHFQVNLETGVLFVSGRIDREQLCAQSLSCNLGFQIILENPLEMYRGEVEILDINDNSPSFPENAIVLQMAESVAPGSRFPLESALDPDIGINTVNTYLISPNENFGLKVHVRKNTVTNAELLLEKFLDREKQASFQLVLTAVDGGKPQRTGTTQLTINVLDSNDNAPVFENDIYTASLEENAPVGTLVIKINAVDLDQGTNAEFKYSFSNLVPERVQELFSLDPESGEIKVQKLLDYENEKSYELDVQAVDNGSPSITGHSKVLIDLIDMNDNVPKITVTSMSGKVPENAAPGTVVALVDIIDRDSGANGEVHCDMTVDLPFKFQSYLNNHYKVTTTRLLDRETTPTYNIPVTVWDSGSPPLSTNTTIEILVSDVNDNTPQFSQSSYAVYVMENNVPGASIFALTVFDPDLDQNSYISYSFTGNLQDSVVPTYFSINYMNGTIYALRSFDYEQVKSFQFHVQARDAGVPPLSSSATVSVIILDQNDNAPVIVYPSAPGGSSPMEILPHSAGQGYLVTKIMATDADSGQNARLSYQIVQATDPTLFSVGRNSGEIRTTRSILELDDTSQNILVLVRDNGQPSLSSTATIVLSILGNVTESVTETRDFDINPSYVSDMNFYLLVTFGSTSILFFLIIVFLFVVKCKQDGGIVLDGGCPNCCCKPRNSKEVFIRGDVRSDPLNCAGTGQNGSFPEGYQYSVCLTPESSKSEFLFLKPYNPNFTQVQQTMVNSQNNNAMVLLMLNFILLFILRQGSGLIRFSIPEELEYGSSVGNIAENLGLIARELSLRKCRLVSGDGSRYLEVNLETGLLFVSGRIDREQLCTQGPTCNIAFQVVLETPLEMYRGEVEILDINDNPPSFQENTIVLQMAESVAPGTRFPLESALDPDVGSNTVKTYTITPNENFGLKVHIRKNTVTNAELVLEKSLDREKQASFDLVLTAVDGGNPPRSGTTQIKINLLDINDNAPMFENDVYTARLKENAPIGTLVIKIKAVDLDQGINAELRYSFSNLIPERVRELFSLDAETGAIKVREQLDFENEQSYELDVQAVDNGSPSITGHAKVLIDLIDVNDNAPEITVTSISGKIPEDVAPGTVVALLDVTDHDSGANGLIRSEIPLGLPFKIESSQNSHYKVTTTRPLDRETAPTYKIPVTAWDAGSPPLSTNKTIEISVSDVNDSTPQFSQSSYAVYVMENNSPGGSIFTLTAIDSDLDQNCYISYSFWGNLQDSLVLTYFSINSMNGTIYALRSFDYEKVKSFQFHVQARDAGVPPLSSSATVNVIILDQNDNAPVIVSPSAQSGTAAVVILPQSAGQGYLVTKIIATDADSGQNARLSYQIFQATDPTLFSVGRISGEIRTARSILDLDDTSQSIVVLVRDNGQPSLSGTATIFLSILGNVTETIPETRDFHSNPGYASDINLYLLVTFGSTSVSFLLIIVFLVVLKCKQDGGIVQDGGCPICCSCPRNSREVYMQGDAPRDPLNCTGTGQTAPFPERYHYSVCLSPESSKSEFLFLKPYNPSFSQGQR
ncbi:protocadherin-10-like [Mobula hypostoma]|uniref:protocadherin-10-like n=1 Tax=Mobula hypostoma TaxID=723540 RepID=UPI002FC3C526